MGRQKGILVCYLYTLLLGKFREINQLLTHRAPIGGNTDVTRQIWTVSKFRSSNLILNWGSNIEYFKRST